MILMIFSHLMMSRMLLSSSCILVLLLCLSHDCNGRHLTSIDDHALDAQLLSHSATKGFEKVNLKMSKGRNQANTVDGHNQKQKDYKELNKKEMMKTEKVKKEAVHGQHHHPKSVATVTFGVPPKNKQVQQQPGFNLDYSPPKTHPPSHN